MKRLACFFAYLLWAAFLVSLQAQVYTWTTIAGSVGSRGSADGTNSEARFDYPWGIALDNSGNLYVSDDVNHTIRRICRFGTNWVVSTIAGMANKSGSADGTNSQARFDYPEGVAVDSAGNIYVVDNRFSTIRRIAPEGTNWVVTTLAGSGDGAADGTNRVAKFYGPDGIAVASNGELFVGDVGNHTIRKITPINTNWVVTTFTGVATLQGTRDGTNNYALFNDPCGVSVDSSGTVYTGDFDNYTVRKVSLFGTNRVVTTIAGLAGARGFDDGTNNEARFWGPDGVTLGSEGDIIVVDCGASTIRLLKPVNTDWVVTTIGGSAGNAGFADGTGSDARFDSPRHVTVDSDGNLYIPDCLNHVIRLGRLIPSLECSLSGSSIVLSWPGTAVN
jgi:hypothetical protein